MHGAGGRARDGRRPRRGDVDGDVRPGFSISRLSRRGVHVGGGAGPAEAWGGWERRRNGRGRRREMNWESRERICMGKVLSYIIDANNM